MSGGPRTSEYVTLVPILPFYRIVFHDGTFFDYDGDPDSTRRQIAELAPQDLATLLDGQLRAQAPPPARRPCHAR